MTFIIFRFSELVKPCYIIVKINLIIYSCYVIFWEKSLFKPKKWLRQTKKINTSFYQETNDRFPHHCWHSPCDTSHVVAMETQQEP